LVGVVRIADPHGDGPGVNVAVINVPTILAIFGSAAGEGGHAAIEAPDMEQGKPANRQRGGVVRSLAWPPSP
jgi:hypothetical protein